ncbi:TonB-dependent receptor domain-containing protein [Pedobacter nototheniae]|uniref:TonB-dependent receptor domain-containing protein n=1 Tax=Pedobacter nototheniae TaxID=2488994 RepID=UPI00292E0808|nr:TonB-dependent receptor [Pedobacter nototheniae]
MIAQTKRITSLSVFLSFLFTVATYAQNKTIQIKGIIIDEYQNPLPGCTIVLYNAENKEMGKVISDSSGSFTLNPKVASRYKVTVTHTGFSPFQSSFYEFEDRDFGKIQLVTESQNLKDVVIQSKQNLIETNGTNLIYNVQNSISAQGSTAFDALKKAPGIYIDNDNNISLNGKTGAMVLLDGKQTYLSAKDITDLLKSMPASGLKSIEIINSPTAKYDAAGSAGIINIKTLKTQISGFSGSTTTGLSYGVSLKQNQDLSFSYRKNKFNLFGGYNHFFGNYAYLYGSDRIQEGNRYNSFTDDTDKRKKMSGRLGIDYNLNKKNTIGFLMNGNFLFGGGITETKTDISLPNSTHINQVLDAVNDYYSQQTQRYNFNVNYKYEDSLGRLLNIDADYGYYQKGSGNLQSNRYTNDQQQVTSDNLYRSVNAANINLFAAKLDYSSNLLGGKFETGLKFSSTQSANDSRFLLVLPTTETLDENRSNAFEYDEKISSAYADYKKIFSKWTFEAGLRLERSDSKGSLFATKNGQNTINKVPRNYTNLFPSASISYKPVEGHSFSIGYSRRIDRPAYQDLNPFTYLLDELSFWQGNPFLQPQLSHRIIAQYAFKSSTIIGFTFARTNGFTTEITDTIDVNKIIMMPRNLGVQENLSLSLTQNINATNWWNLNFNGVIYHLNNKITYDAYRSQNLKQLASRITLQQNFKLPFKLNGEISTAYNTKRLAGGNKISKANSQVDLGLQKSFMENKASVRLVFSDIYKGNKLNSLQSLDNFSIRSYGYFESRQIRLNFTYKFANGASKGPRDRKSALDNENGRIK